ncbi:unnamed protein product, partial [Amoebophrya sp. A120]|eukprot:GSA120T00009180001.1
MPILHERLGQNWTTFGNHATQIFSCFKFSMTSCILPDPDIFTFHTPAPRSSTSKNSTR